MERRGFRYFGEPDRLWLRNAYSERLTKLPWELRQPLRHLDIQIAAKRSASRMYVLVATIKAVISISGSQLPS